MPQHAIKSILTLCLAGALIACKKKEEAVIEEVPAAAAPIETDTSAALAEEPSLQKVGEETTIAQTSAAAQGAGFSDHGSFVVQVSVFKSSRQAANLVEKLAAQGFPAYVAQVETPVPELEGTYHRVRIGRFAHIADARAFGENTLRSMGYDFWVDNKRNDMVGAGEGAAYSAPAAPPPAPNPEPSYSAPPAEPSITSPSEPASPPPSDWSTPSEPAAAPSAPPAELPASTPPPPDTGKVNLDEW